MQKEKKSLNSYRNSILRPVENSQMLQKMLAMNAMKENPHHGHPVYTPRLTVRFRVADEVLHAAEPSLAASSTRAACALAHRNRQICM
jgi:hypothetical protein